MIYIKRTQAEIEALRSRILEEIAVTPRGMRELAAVLGVGPRSLEHHMDALKAQGKADCFGKRTVARWTTKSAADRINAEEQRRKEQRFADADARREAQRARRAAEDAKIDAEIEVEAHAGGAVWSRTVKRVPAESVKAEIAGPRSVWDLAA